MVVVVVVVVVSVVVDVVGSVVVEGASVVGGEGHPVNSVVDLNKTNMSKYIKKVHIYIYFACLGVCLYPINVKMAEQIGPKFCVRLCITKSCIQNLLIFV